MKGFYALSVIVAIIIVMCRTDAMLFNKNKRVQTKVCTVSATCPTNTNVCARIGTSNSCARFRDICRFNDANCIRDNIYTSVDLAACVNIAVGTNGTCVGLPVVATTVNTGSNKFGNKLGLGLGLGLFGNNLG